ncbi:hypothetical protein ZWY2020_014135 [Hordeum vulgare]|nr:hypothetical protein ZWY2020_014135 [Hordeum vulgare]
MFPLLPKSSLLQRLIVEASQGSADEVRVDGLPGGARAFEICAKFCYGMVVTLNPYNVVAARCAAEHLGMTEDVDKNNLVFKIDLFLNSGVFRSWKDSIITLQSTVALLPWSEELRLVARCVDSIAAKATASPGAWSGPTYNRKAASSDEIVEARRCSSSSPAVPRDWWVEDLCELDVELYKRVMVAGAAEEELLDRIVLQLHDASVNDLLIPVKPPSQTAYESTWSRRWSADASESVQGGEEEDLEPDGREEAVQKRASTRRRTTASAARGGAGALLPADARGGGGERERGAPAGRRRDSNAHLELDDDDGGGDCSKNRALALALPEPPTRRRP